MAELHDDPDALFVSSNPDAGPCSRFREGRHVPNALPVFIGAERRVDDPTKIDYFPERVVMIPAEEARKFSREYGRAIRDKSLVRRTREDYVQQAEAERKEIEEQAAAALAERERGIKEAEARAAEEKARLEAEAAAASEREKREDLERRATTSDDDKSANRRAGRGARSGG